MDRLKKWLDKYDYKYEIVKDNNLNDMIIIDLKDENDDRYHTILNYLDRYHEEKRYKYNGYANAVRVWEGVW